VQFRDNQGRETTFTSRRLVHMADQHLAAIEMILTAENRSGRLLVRSALDGRVVNAGVTRYLPLNSRHLEVLRNGLVDEDDAEKASTYSCR
jgi:trehalose/maltose hydrolase-like predicted phosphorylase